MKLYTYTIYYEDGTNDSQTGMSPMQAVIHSLSKRIHAGKTLTVNYIECKEKDKKYVLESSIQCTQVHVY